MYPKKVRCPACGERLLYVDAYDSAVEHGVDPWLRCPECGTVFEVSGEPAPVR